MSEEMSQPIFFKVDDLIIQIGIIISFLLYYLFLNGDTVLFTDLNTYRNS